jgi:hypothetical protein
MGSSGDRSGYRGSPLGGDRLEPALIGCGVKGASHRVEFTQVNGENLHAILRGVSG